MSILELNKRNGEIPNSAKKSRRKGNVPGILYGKAVRSMMFEVGEIELVSEISTNGEHGIIEVNLNGEKHKALIKEVQRDPATNKIIHLDLEELKGKNKITSSVPIHYIGEDFINRKGIVLQKEKDSVKIECNIDALPKSINMDIGNGEVGSVYKFGDLEVASEISIIDDLNSVIASIIYERKTVSDDMENAIENSNSSDEKK